LARLTEIVPFSPITEDIVLMIFNIHLKGLLKNLEEQNIEFVIEENAKKKMATSGFNAQYGARPILGIIRKELRQPLSKMIISGNVKSGSKIVLKLKGDKYEWKY
jgi:ATP-dependent Clp protease ATP-binding subunit ClpA